MVATIKKGASKQEIEAINKRMQESSVSKNKFDAYKYCGAVIFEEDGLEIQKKLRDEWE
ncbi:MAG: hypothetical protein ACERKD_15645 [Prolixibacteraceae bacterium]